MDTPRTVNRMQRLPLGTPTMSNSKKSLFGKDVEDEADIGPMTPLRFGSLRRNQRRSNNALSNITSFRNLFGNESPDSERSLSPDFERRYTNNGRYELVSADFDKENMAHAVDEETRFSFSSSIPETPSSRLSAEESAVLDENNSNSLSMLMNSDLNLVEKRAKTLHRTPGVTTRSHATNKTTQRSVDPCLRRTQQQHLQGVKRAHTGTPDNSSQSPSYAEIERSAAKRPNTRARTALQFNDILPIPTKSFYSSAPAEKNTPVKIHAPISSKSFYASASSQPQTIAISDHLSPENERSISTTHESPSAKHASTSKTPRKAVRKRTKSFSSNAPRLGQRGTVHKIRKPVKKTAESQTPKKRGSRNQQKNRAIAGGTKSCPTTPKSGNDTVEPEHDEMLHRLKHVNRILRQGQKNLTRALSMSLSMTDLSKGALSCEEDANSSSSEDEDSVSEQEAEGGNGDTGKRKFFRSSRKSRSIRRVYNHFNSIAIGVQKGGKRKVLSFPQAPKRRRIGFEQDDFNFANEQLEVDDLISKLDYGDGCEKLDCDSESRHHVAMQDQNDEDDEPIPIQSNVIYLSADDEFALENNCVEQSMQHLEPDHTNGSIIIHHSEAEGPVDIVEDDESVLHSCSYDTFPAVGEQYTGFIANSSTIIIQHNEYHSSSTSYQNDSSISTTIMNSSTVSQCHYQSQCQVDDTTQTTANQEANAYYPIFYSDRVKELWRQERQQTATESTQTDVFQLLRQQDNHGRGAKSNTQRRHGVGHDQYQIDAGQQAYGAIRCKECGLTYSTHEPEEEQFHDAFHRSQAKLTFTGGQNEHVAAQVPEWDVTGRIIVVSQTDSNKHLLRKIHGVLEVVDSELGFSTQGELPEGACVYLAIARSTVLGICVVQPLQYANRMICLEGLHGVPIDCYSSEFYPARCGISRLWVAPKYRRLGIGRKLLGAIRHHYIFGYTMTLDEIAFGAPTEMGKLFAEAVSGRKDFLVYI